MNPEAQRIAIAEACGWTDIEPCTCFYRVSRGYQPTWGAHKKHIPDYLKDLNAMHEAEKVLLKLDTTCGFWQTYSNRLACLLGCTDIFHATATQRAEAFLRAIGKWEDGT